MTISIGAMFGGPELADSAINSVVGAAMRARDKIAGPAPSTLVVRFMVAGSIVKDLEFTGLRTGSFSKAKQRLVIQVAVPPSVVNASEKTIATFIVDSLREAVALAKPKFLKAKLEYPEQRLLEVVESIDKALAARSE